MAWVATPYPSDSQPTICQPLAQRWPNSSNYCWRNVTLLVGPTLRLRQQPTISQRCPNHQPTLPQPSANVAPTISQRCPNHQPTLPQPSANVAPTISQRCQPSANVAPTISQRCPNHLPTLPQPSANVTPTIRQRYPNHPLMLLQPYFSVFPTFKNEHVYNKNIHFISNMFHNVKLQSVFT